MKDSIVMVFCGVKKCSQLTATVTFPSTFSGIGSPRRFINLSKQVAINSMQIHTSVWSVSSEDEYAEWLGKLVRPYAPQGVKVTEESR